MQPNQNPPTNTSPTLPPQNSNPSNVNPAPSNQIMGTPALPPSKPSVRFSLLGMFSYTLILIGSSGITISYGHGHWNYSLLIASGSLILLAVLIVPVFKLFKKHSSNKIGVN